MSVIAPFVLAILVAHGPSSAQGSAAQQMPASSPQVAAETPWPAVGVFRQDPGITAPRVISETKPRYTADAMRVGVQGSIQLEAVVQTDGTVGEVRVVRSLDQKFGMDEEAIKAIKQWRFTPGKKDDVAVPVIVEVELTFTMGMPKRRWLPRFLGGK